MTDEALFELVGTPQQRAIIKVIGVGGGGNNAVEHMLTAQIEGVEFICANTDAQALKKSRALHRLQLGEQITKGLGAGADPDVGRRSAEADRERIKNLLQGTDMLFITAGMGGGTGTGAAPVIAEMARELGILTVAVVTRPFSFEGKKRAQVAKEGMQALGRYVDSLITIPNDKLLGVLGKNITLLNAFKAANNVLLGAVQGIAELIIRPGLINVDFADVRTVMSEMGMAMMGSGIARGDNRAHTATEAAIASPLLEDIDLSGARGILVNITAGPDLSIGEFEEVGETIRAFASENATVVVGTVIDPDIKEELRVTVVVTGLTQSSILTTPASPSLDDTPLAPVNALENNYVELDKPTLLRQQVASTLPRGSTVHRNGQGGEVNEDLDYLDIPSFLRRHEKKT